MGSTWMRDGLLACVAILSACSTAPATTESTELPISGALALLPDDVTTGVGTTGAPAVMGLDVRLVGDLDAYRAGDGDSTLTSLSLLAWPSREPVSADVAATELPGGRFRYQLTPRTPLSSGWYAISFDSSVLTRRYSSPEPLGGVIVHRFLWSSGPMLDVTAEESITTAGNVDFTVGSSEALVNQSGRSFLDLFLVHGASTGTCAAASPTLEQDLMQNGRTVVTCSGVRFDEMLTVTVSAGLESPSGVALMGVDGMRPAQVTWNPAVDGARAPHEPVEAVFAASPGAAR